MTFNGELELRKVKMNAVATDGVTWSVYVRLCVGYNRTRALQKRLNRSRSRLGEADWRGLRKPLYIGIG